MARVGAGARIELERGAGLRERGRQASCRRPRLRPGALVLHPAAGRGQADRQRRELEALRHAPGEHVERAIALGGQQDVSTEIVQAGQFVAPRDGVALPGLRRRGPPAGRDGGGQERDQGHPVLRIGDGEGPDRRQEEEVERQHRADRQRHRHPPARERGGAQHDDEQRQSHGRRIGDGEGLQRRHTEAEEHQAGDELQPVASRRHGAQARRSATSSTSSALMPAKGSRTPPAP